jgi:uncharacterized OB-fold protein
MSLQSLEEYNKQALERAFKKKMHPRLTGIACPHCGQELQDSDNAILTTVPPQKRIKCFACNFVGTRFHEY